MRDAMGGIFNIAFLAVFITVISGYLAFTVSYSKAFKVKNKIISVIEQYSEVNDSVRSQVKDYIKKVGYNTDVSQTQFDTVKQENPGFTCERELGFCYLENSVNDSSENQLSSGYKKKYYSVITFVSVDIPIFNKFLPYLSFFQTKGDTMTIYVK